MKATAVRMTPEAMKQIATATPYISSYSDQEHEDAKKLLE
jgi:hypothetical protein